MPDRTALSKLRPVSRGDWHQVRVVSGYLAVIAVFVVAIFFFKHKHREDVEHNWKCATAIIEEVRPRVIERVESARGGAMLYEVSIFAKYVSDGAEHEQWIVVEQPPVSLAEAELQTFRWKGQRCVVRWKAAKPEELIAEVD
jgi:hypothetical protein